MVQNGVGLATVMFGTHMLSPGAFASGRGITAPSRKVELEANGFTLRGLKSFADERRWHFGTTLALALALDILTFALRLLGSMIAIGNLETQAFVFVTQVLD